MSRTNANLDIVTCAGAEFVPTLEDDAGWVPELAGTAGAAKAAPKRTEAIVMNCILMVGFVIGRNCRVLRVVTMFNVDR